MEYEAMAKQGSYHTSNSYVPTLTNNCSILCERLLKLRWRRQYLESGIQMDATTKNFGGFTSARIGPPGDLTEEDGRQWKKALEHTWKTCVTNILIPSMIRKEGAVEVKLADRLFQIDSPDSYRQFIDSINRGIKHASQKYYKKYRAEEISRGNSRRGGLLNKEKYSTNLGNGTVNFIQRGEVYTREQDGFIKNSWIKDRENVFMILAHAIYNRTKLHKLLVRKMWEYIDGYEEEEKQYFRPFLGDLANGQTRYINSWRQLRIALKNRELKTTRYELTIIAKLYCVQIRIMHDITIHNDPSIVRERYQCIWETERRTGRVVNLLEQSKGTWALLEGMQINQPVFSKSNPRGQEDIEEVRVVKNIENTYRPIISIGKNTAGEKDERGKESHREEGKRNSITTNIVSEIDYETIHSDLELEINRKEEREKTTYRSTEQDNIHRQELLESKEVLEIKYGSTDVDILGRSIRSNREREEVSSDTTTESVKALFYGEEYREIDTDRREINEESFELNVDPEKLRYSNISSATTNTLPSIDSLENSLLHLTQRISVMKLGKDQKQASKTALKNTLWQRCRIIERNRRRNEVKKRETKDIKEGKKIENSKLVFDFTSKGLDRDEIEILSKGESFSIANDKIDEDRLKVDLYNYTRRLRILDEITDRNNTTETGLSQFSKITISQENSQNSNRRSNSLSNIAEEPNRRSSSLSNRARCSKSLTKQSQVSRNYNMEERTLVRSDGDSTQCHRNSHIEEITEASVEQKRGHININKGTRSLPSLYDPLSENRNLIRYNNCIQEEGLLVTKKKIPFRDNISPQLREALKSLQEKVTQKEIIITKADKGSGIVVLDYELYIQKGTNYIEIESLAYKRADASEKDIVSQITKERNKIVTKLKKENIIQERTATYCTHQIEEKVTGMKFYYKVHKDTNITTMPLRPLQSCISSPTHHLSQVLTDILQPLLIVDNIPTFIQDSNQLLFRLSKLPMLDNSTTIITSDVAALYPSIPHREGLEAMETFLKTASYFSIVQINCIVQALELVITKNYVKWNGILYEQTKGVAMGTPVAVAYANIFMHWVDTEIRKKAPYIIEHMRYIDDNLFIIPERKIAELISVANSILSPSIKYTYEALDREGEEGLPFLDTRLFISEEYRIESRLYTKKTDKHAYLLPSSYHPAHITKNIPLSTFYRLRRICSKEEWFKADAMLAIEWLEDRDYKHKDITRAIEKAIDKDRWTLIENIERKRGERKQMSGTEEGVNTIPIIVTYSQKTAQLKTVLKQRQELLDASFTEARVKPRISYRRQNNIGDLLVQKSLRGPIGGTERIERKFIECGIEPKYRTHCPCKGEHNRRKCRCCSHAWFEPKDIKVKIHKTVNCDSKNLVYLIICGVCKKKYVGETQQRLRDRFMQHLTNIQKLKQPLYTHFKTVHKPEELKITVLETVKSAEPFMRKIREAWWINHLQTLEPKGFNVKLECNQVYLEDRRNRVERERLAKEKGNKNRRDSNRTSIG